MIFKIQLVTAAIMLLEASAFLPAPPVPPRHLIIPHGPSSLLPELHRTSALPRLTPCPARKRGGDLKDDMKQAPAPPSLFDKLMRGQDEDEDTADKLKDLQEQQQRLQRVNPSQGPIPLPTKPNLVMIGFGVGVAVVLGAIGLIVGHYVGVEPLAGMTLTPDAFALGAGLAIPLFLVDAFLQFYQEDTASELYSLSIFGTRTPLIQVLALASIMTLATGFGEEILFRGLVQQGLSANLGGFLGLLGGSLIFGLAHKLGPSDFFFICLSGAWMGLAYELTGDITVPIALHAVYDLLILGGAYLRGQRRIRQ